MANPPITGAFVPTTNVWDVSNITSIEGISPELKELLIRLYQNLNIIALNINIRDAGYYNLFEFINGQLFFPNPTASFSSVRSTVFRPVTRKVINFGALPNTGTTSVAHGIAINDGYTFTRIYGAASDTTGNTYIPLPYASPTLVNNIELYVDATNVNIITGSNRSNYNVCYVVLEYLTQ